ncbi:hypothetical protein GCM10010393_52140 [Streptomyces gobitricini]|uniref:Uncharacterized protein n=1 Tax=Streptomyces gobitricini TaxID=68211 RepID=A0ABP6A9L9_9ACTN
MARAAPSADRCAEGPSARARKGRESARRSAVKAYTRVPQRVRRKRRQSSAVTGPLSITWA